jgi:hypothetical protein
MQRRDGGGTRCDGEEEQQECGRRGSCLLLGVLVMWASHQGESWVCRKARR